MRRQSITVLTAAIVISMVFSINAYALSGSGTEADPWRIQSLADFNDFTGDPNYWDEHARLEIDVNLAGIPYTTAVIAPDTNSSSDYFQGTPFTGIFEGNDHTISNLTIDTAGKRIDYLGLFGKIEGSSAEVKNLGIEDCNITSGDGHPEFLGGLCGYNSGSISNCYVSGSVTGGHYSENLGGLCGHNTDGSISNCYATGSVTGGDHSDYLGGLCGENENGTITGCYATDSVTGGDDSWYLGGLCGDNDNGTISNCYSTGTVTGGVNSDYLGGLCGGNTGAVSDCFWDTETSGISTSDGGTGKTTIQMKTVSTFLDAGWDMVAIWNIEEYQTYPFLRKYLAIDTNYDNKVDFFDFAIFAEYWLW